VTAAIVAIDVERLEALANALHDAAEELVAVRSAARSLAGLDLAVLGPAASALDYGAASARRGAAIVRRLPSMDRPPHTSVLLGHPVADPYPATGLARRLFEVRQLLRLRHAGPEEAGAALRRFLAAVGEDERAAAAAMEVLGAGGLRVAYELALAEAGDPEELDEAGRAALEARIEAVTHVALLASRTVDRPGGLPRAVVDELLPRDGQAPGPWAVTRLVSAAGAGQYFAEAAATAVGSGRVGLVVRAGRVLAFGGLALGVVDALAHGGEGLGESLVTGGLGVVGAVVGGPVGWLVGGLSLVLTVALAVGAQPGRPPARTYPANRPSPGGTHYERYVDGAGVPVAPPS